MRRAGRAVRHLRASAHLAPPPPFRLRPPQAGGCRVGGRFVAGSYQPFPFGHIPVDNPYIELPIGRFWRGVLTSGTTTAFIWNLTAVLCAMPLRAQKKSPTQRTYRIGHGWARVRPRPSHSSTSLRDRYVASVSLRDAKGATLTNGSRAAQEPSRRIRATIACAGPWSSSMSASPAAISESRSKSPTWWPLLGSFLRST